MKSSIIYVVRKDMTGDYIKENVMDRTCNAGGKGDK
jgi:hypothetical protein